MTKVITIPKELAKKGELIIVPRAEYEKFLNWRKSVKTFRPTAAERKALREARKDFKNGKYITLQELKNELEGSHPS